MNENHRVEQKEPAIQPVLGSAVGGLRFELVLNKPPKNASLEDLEVPFATLSATGYFSNILLARIAMGEDTTIRYFALKLQRSDYQSRSFNSLHSNSRILKLWQAERDNLTKLSNISEEIVKLFDFGAMVTSGSKNKQEIYQSKPITFCKRKQVYFHPICPVCVSFLEDCRDESLLAENGLPGYSNSSIRYIYCAQCAKKTKKPIFYTFSSEQEELHGTKAAIRRRAELYYDFSRIIQQKENFKKNSEDDQFLSFAFPCYSCEYQNECYNSKEAVSKTLLVGNRLTPVSFYNCVLLPLELLHIHYDEFCDLLGGASWDNFKNSKIKKGITYAQQLVLEMIQLFFTSGYQYIFKDDPGGLFALEILRLKLITFTQLCRGIYMFHKSCLQPHLDIRPGSVMVKLPLIGSDLPTRWNFSVKILDLGATIPFDEVKNDPDILKRIFYPPHNFQKIYSSPILYSSQFGHEEKMNVNIRSVKQLKETKGAVPVLVEADLLSREINAADFCDRDLIRINLNSPAKGLENIIIWATKSDTQEHGLRVIGKSAPISQKSYAALESCKGDMSFETNVAFYKTFHTPCDVYSLGMMLLRTILVNDEQDLWQVWEVINRMIFPLHNIKFNTAKEVELEIKRMLNQKKQILSPKAIFYKKQDRELQENAISENLWQKIMVFAFKFFTHIKGFSYCANHGDYDPNNPGATMENILFELEEINSTIHAYLFGSCEGNKDILEICDDMIKALSKEEQVG